MEAGRCRPTDGEDQGCAKGGLSRQYAGQHKLGKGRWYMSQGLVMVW